MKKGTKKIKARMTINAEIGIGHVKQSRRARWATALYHGLAMRYSLVLSDYLLSM